MHNNKYYNNKFLHNFRYEKVIEKGKPIHDKYDSFSAKHPSMDLNRRAKIFSPFDALKGFNEAILETEEAVERQYSKH